MIKPVPLCIALAIAAAALTWPHKPALADIKGDWLVEDIDGKGVIDMARTTLSFIVDGQAAGSGGCNRYSGSVTFSSNDISFGLLAVTRKMCSPALMNQEMDFFRALDAAKTFKVDGAFLRIYDAAGNALLRLTKL